MRTRERNVDMKWRPCLRCGRKMWTDRNHRLCRRCHLTIERLDYRIPDRYTFAVRGGATVAESVE